MTIEAPVQKTDRVLRQALSETVTFVRSIEDEQQFRSKLNGVNVATYDFRVRGLLQYQIERLQQLLSKLPEQKSKEE